MLTAAFRSLISPALELAPQHLLGPARSAARRGGARLARWARSREPLRAPRALRRLGSRAYPPSPAAHLADRHRHRPAQHPRRRLAVGVSFGGPDVAIGMSAALGIGLQNLLEGLAVVAALASINYPRKVAFAVALDLPLEPVSGFMGSPWCRDRPIAAGGLGLRGRGHGRSAPRSSRDPRQGTPRRRHGSAMAGLILMVVIDARLGGRLDPRRRAARQFPWRRSSPRPSAVDASAGRNASAAAPRSGGRRAAGLASMPAPARRLGTVSLTGWRRMRLRPARRARRSARFPPPARSRCCRRAFGDCAPRPPPAASTIAFGRSPSP